MSLSFARGDSLSIPFSLFNYPVSTGPLQRSCNGIHYAWYQAFSMSREPARRGSLEEAT